MGKSCRQPPNIPTIIFKDLDNQVNEGEKGGTCSIHMAEMKTLYKVSAGEREGNRRLETRRHRSHYNIKMDLKERVCADAS